MPSKPKKHETTGTQGPLASTIDALQESIFTSNHGISQDFIRRNEKIVKQSNRAAADVLNGFGVSTIAEGRNSIQELAQLVQNSIRYKSNKIRSGTSVFDSEDPSGIRTLTPMGNIDQSEQEIITQNSMLYQSFLSITSEYRGIVEIIPELNHAIQNIVRDILNTSELSKRYFNSIYTDKHNSITKIDRANGGKSPIDRCNELLQTEIIDKNKLEVKFERWLNESVISGVKPVAFIPYDYIVRQLDALNKAGDLIDINNVATKLKSGESCSIVNNENDLSSFYARCVESSAEDMIKNEYAGQESVAIDLKVNSAFEDIIDDSLVSDFMHDFEASFSEEGFRIEERRAKIEDTVNRNSFLGLESQQAIKELDLVKSISDSYSDQKKKMDEMSDENKKSAARKGLVTLAKWIDSNIDVVKPNASAAFTAAKIIHERDRYKSFYDLGKNYKLPETLTTMGYKDPASNKDKETYDTTPSIGKECLIVPYSPESIIPINVNGEYMGFYCLEYEHLLGPMWKNRSKTGSFTDYVRQQGYGSDSNLLGGNTTMMSHGGTDPLENNLYSPASIYNYSASQYLTGTVDSADRKLDMMKVVAMRVLAHRLHDPDLVDNKIFKDSVMHMLRNDILTRKKVQFTFIPPEYMCYMTYKTDDNGLPISILDGTLFFAYLYISSVVSSGMIKLLKSSDKEKYEIDVGLQKNIGYSVDEIQRNLSTRTLYTQSMFSSLSSVIKNAGSYQRLIIPVVRDKKLYDVTQIEHMNNLDPDDQYTEKLLRQILMKIYVNSGAASEFDNVDFAKQLSMRNLEYRNNIIKAQANYEPFATKMLRILAHYSKLKTYNSEAEVATGKKDGVDPSTKEQMLDLSCIEVQFSPPTFLTMTNIIEVLNTAKDMANSIAEVYDLQGGNSIADATAALFKRKIVRKYAQCLRFEEIDDMLEEARAEAPSVAVGKTKTAKTDEIVNTPPEDQNGGGMGGGMGGEDEVADSELGEGGGDEEGGEGGDMDLGNMPSL